MTEFNKSLGSLSLQRAKISINTWQMHRPRKRWSRWRRTRVRNYQYWDPKSIDKTFESLDLVAPRAQPVQPTCICPDPSLRQEQRNDTQFHGLMYADRGMEIEALR